MSLYQTCRSIELEHHRSPCRCSCLLKAEDCSVEQRFDPGQCGCSCEQKHNLAKYRCALDPARQWDETRCGCVCRRVCPPGQELKSSSCSCAPVTIATCSISPVSLATSHPAKIATYIGLVALTVLGLTIAVTLYFILIRQETFSSSQSSF